MHRTSVLLAASVLSAASIIGIPAQAEPSCARTVPVANTAELQKALTGSKPGDCVVAADGNYSAVTVTAKEVTISARNLGKAVFTSGSLQLKQSVDTTLSGFTWTSGGNIMFTDCVGCRITRWTFPKRSGGGELIDFAGSKNDRNRIDHSDFGPRGQKGRYIYVRGGKPTLATRTQIDHNHFHDVGSGPQGGECIVLGGVGAWGDYQNTFSVVEHNLFTRCDGDAEVISTKASSNIIRHNTVRDSKGQIVLRAGNKNQVYGNVILGWNKEGAGGIRIHEEDHLIYNNYVETKDAPLIVGGGTPRGPGFSHAQVFRPKIVNNTFIGRDDGVHIGQSGRLPVVDMTFANNVVRAHAGKVVNVKTTPTRPIYVSSILHPQGSAAAGITGPAFLVADPKFARSGELFKLADGSPAVDKGSTAYEFVTVDVDMQARAAHDIGADERSTAPESYRPLTAADVGPLAP
ncbi:hypothetical protein FKR81_25785 [Lentzea tibetensis]|uniref:Lyase n=1 Tax=Lentzea tibetensis TaxID=2591470 RepID=A0A563EPE9_9PSEU|nr:polysaccharide lyase 6 family protein [Lentzea tibetensis]TWP49085.1 hypothetical protein FKR81_25785 [Lentzea tibetensis]